MERWFFFVPLDLVVSQDDAWTSCCHIAMSLKVKPVLGTAEQSEERTWDLDDIELLDQQVLGP